MSEELTDEYELLELLQKRELEVFQLKRANSKLRRLLKQERRKSERIRTKRKKKKQHYRNGRKRGRTMNG